MASIVIGPGITIGPGIVVQNVPQLPTSEITTENDIILDTENNLDITTE